MKENAWSLLVKLTQEGQLSALKQRLARSDVAVNGGGHLGTSGGHLGTSGGHLGTSGGHPAALCRPPRTPPSDGVSDQ